MMQNRLKDRDRGGYTSDRYRPHDNYTNAFNMLAQIGLAEKEVTNSMRNAVTQAANVKALQDRLKFDVSSYSAKLKQSALDSSAGQQMKYQDLIQTYMDSNADKRKKEIEKWAKDNENNFAENNEGDSAFKKAVKDYKEKVYEMDMDTAKKIYEPILKSIDSHLNYTQEYIGEFDNANVFSFYTNDSVENNQDNKSSVWKSIGSSIIKTNAIIGKFFKNFFSKDSIDSHSNYTQEYIKEFDNTNVFGSPIIRPNAIIGKFFKKFFSKGDE